MNKKKNFAATAENYLLWDFIMNLQLATHAKVLKSMFRDSVTTNHLSGKILYLVLKICDFLKIHFTKKSRKNVFMFAQKQQYKRCRLINTNNIKGFNQYITKIFLKIFGQYEFAFQELVESPLNRN